MKKETASPAPVLTNADVAQGIQRVEETLSEVLVLLYHVVQSHQDLAEAVRVDSVARSITSRLIGREQVAAERELRDM
jgi:hypothetical protein